MIFNMPFHLDIQFLLTYWESKKTIVLKLIIYVILITEIGTLPFWNIGCRPCHTIQY